MFVRKTSWVYNTVRLFTSSFCKENKQSFNTVRLFTWHFCEENMQRVLVPSQPPEAAWSPFHSSSDWTLWSALAGTVQNGSITAKSLTNVQLSTFNEQNKANNGQTKQWYEGWKKGLHTIVFLPPCNNNYGYLPISSLLAVTTKRIFE